MLIFFYLKIIYSKNLSSNSVMTVCVLFFQRKAVIFYSIHLSRVDTSLVTTVAPYRGYRLN